MYGGIENDELRRAQRNAMHRKMGYGTRPLLSTEARRQYHEEYAHRQSEIPKGAEVVIQDDGGNLLPMAGIQFPVNG